jgi:hypothetical protein
MLRLSTFLAVTTALSLSQSISAQTATDNSAADCGPQDGVQFVCGHSAAEDLAFIPGTNWVLASSFTGDGGIRLVNVTDRSVTTLYPSADAKEALDKKTYGTCPGPVDGDDRAKFITHGLALSAGKHGRYTLYAVHHGKRESVEVFELRADGAPPSLTWIGCAIAPDPIGLNSIVGLPGGGFVATNFAERGPGASASFAKAKAGENNGELWEWHAGKGWTQIPGSEGSGLNGVEVSKDGKWLYVAGWGSQSFFRMARRQPNAARKTVALGFHSDNVRWTPDGALLVGGQGDDSSEVVKIDPQTLTVTHLLNRPNNAAFGFGTVGIQVGKTLWVGSYKAERIAIFPLP